MLDRFVSIGEAMVEFSRNDDGQWRQAFAGDTLNVAWAMRALGGPDRAVDYVTRVGTDGFSRRFLDFLGDAGIGAEAIGRDPDRAMGLYTIETDAEGERSFTYWRGQSAARRLMEDESALDRALDDAALVYLSGITLAILGPEARRALLSRLARAARPFRVAFDPNIRPRLWEDGDTMRAAIEDAARVADIVLPTFDDEAAAFGDGSPAATRDRYLALGAGEVVVKDGIRATLFAAGITGSILVRDPVRAIDTTGAGDSFNGGYLAARLGGREPPDAIRQAQAVSRAVVGTRGALLAMEALRDAAGQP